MSILDKYIEKYRKLHTKEENFIQLYPYDETEPTEKDVGDEVMVGNQLANKFKNSISIIYNALERPLSILDYGCGRPNTIHAFFQLNPMKIRQWVSYDPAVPGFDVRPVGKFDVIFCADVLEHIPEEVLDEVLEDIKQYLTDDGIVAFSTTGDLAHKTFLDGENIHCTLKGCDEWMEILSSKFENIIMIYSKDNGSAGKTRTKTIQGKIFTGNALG